MNKSLLLGLPVLLAACAPSLYVQPISTSATFRVTCPAALQTIRTAAVSIRPSGEWQNYHVTSSSSSGLLLQTEPYFAQGATASSEVSCVQNSNGALVTVKTSNMTDQAAARANAQVLQAVANTVSR